MAVAAIAASCGLIDLRPVEVSVEPAEAYAVLPSLDSAVYVRFSAEPLRLDAESAFSVRSASGAVEGDFSWDGASFSWKPVAPWNPGVRYRVALGGSIRTADGRTALPDIDMPFYAVRSSAPPTLVSYSPADGASVGIAEAGEPALTLTFSEAMDGKAVRDALGFRPSLQFELRWDAGMTVASVAASQRLSPCASYAWTLGASARASDGAPLLRSEGAGFATDLDSSPPRVERTYPVSFSRGAWAEAATDLSGLDSGHSIAVLFSEAVDERSARAGIRVEPSVSGRVDAVSPRLAVFTPDGDWEPEAELTLVVSDEVEDLSGLGIVMERFERFRPLEPFLEVLRVESGDGESSADLSGGAILPVTVGIAPEGGLLVTVEFSAAFGPEAKVALVERVSLSVFFPASLPAPELKSVWWSSDDAVTYEWVGLERSGDTTTNYYLFTISGGIDGIAGESGLRIKDDASIYLEAMP